MKKYYGEWYGRNVEWMPYFHEKTDEDPYFWPESEWRIKAKVDHRPNGGFSMQWALTEGGIREVIRIPAEDEPKIIEALKRKWVKCEPEEVK